MIPVFIVFNCMYSTLVLLSMLLMSLAYDAIALGSNQVEVEVAIAFPSNTSIFRTLLNQLKHCYLLYFGFNL